MFQNQNQNSREKTQIRNISSKEPEAPSKEGQGCRGGALKEIKYVKNKVGKTDPIKIIIVFLLCVWGTESLKKDS